MISKEQIETIAARYNIGVSYKGEGAGGFIVDETGIIKDTVIDDILISLRSNRYDQKEKIQFVIDDDMALYAA